MNSSIFPLLTLFLAHLHSRPTHFWCLRILIHAPHTSGAPAYSFTPHNSGAQHTHTHPTIPAPQHTHSRPTFPASQHTHSRPTFPVSQHTHSRPTHIPTNGFIIHKKSPNVSSHSRTSFKIYIVSTTGQPIIRTTCIL